MNAEEEAFNAFGLSREEAGVVYGMLYSQSLVDPPFSELMDEVEKRELFVKTRSQISKAVEIRARLFLDLRDFVVSFAGEESVLEMEKQIRFILKGSY